MQTVTVYLMSLTSSVNYDYVGEIYSSRALAEFAGQKSLTSQSEDFGYAIQPLTVKSDGPVVFSSRSPNCETKPQIKRFGVHSSHEYSASRTGMCRA